MEPAQVLLVDDDVEHAPRAVASEPVGVSSAEPKLSPLIVTLVPLASNRSERLIRQQLTADEILGLLRALRIERIGPCGQRRVGAAAVLVDVRQQHLHLGDLLYLIARDPVGEIAHPRVTEIGLAGIVDGDGMVGDHGLHEILVADQRLTPIDGEQDDPADDGADKHGHLGGVGAHKFYLKDSGAGIVYALLGTVGVLLVVPPIIVAVLSIVDACIE